MVDQANPQAVEIEVCGPNGSQLYFSPAGKALRGFVDFSAARSRSALVLRDSWPEPIPGKVIGITASGEKYIREPLHHKQYAAIQQRIAKRGYVLEEEREVIAGETSETWLYWMRRAVDSGYARVLSGTLPKITDFEGEEPEVPKDKKPRKDFILAKPQSNADKLTTVLSRLVDVLDKQTALLNQLVAKSK